MSEPMSRAELDAHIAELLPQRTVLSLLSFPSARHDPGTQNTQGHNIPSSAWWMIFGYYPSSTDPGAGPAPNTAHSFGIGDAYSRHS